MGRWRRTPQQGATFSWTHRSRSKGRTATIAGWGARSDEVCPSLCQPGCLRAALVGRRPGRLHPGRSHGARVRPSIGALDVHLSGAVLKRELTSSWMRQVKICYAYCKGLKTNACANCNPVRFGEPRGKSSHTVARAPFVVSIVFPRLRKMLTTCDILSNSKRNWNLPLLRGR